ncbi:Cof-type HAD-IIB family hydrolase [Psychromonas ossibalaenae]|uniref:Cof-type HAD-IIB family hydrolase n=1 Tax=Psychromonas ossibalaenae TaxID=444922 RepID=UPI000362334C|nr:Cof-type HAD-IIB family hydrolase [Psychromonas ossibalaenae]
MQETKNEIKAVISDLDGTLLNPQGKITKSTRNVLNQLNCDGVEVIFASGRHPKDISSLITGLDFVPTIIGCNGALEVCRVQGKYKKNIVFNSSIYKQLIQCAASLNLHISVFDSAGWNVTEVNHMVTSYSRQFRFPYQVVAGNELLDLSANKILVWSESNIDSIEQTLVKLFSQSCEISRSSVNSLEISPLNVTKANTIAECLADQGINFEREAIAFGDGMNDEAMLEQAAIGVVMKNAMPELSNRLTKPIYTNSNADDGVADYLIGYFGLAL